MTAIDVTALVTVCQRLANQVKRLNARLELLERQPKFAMVGGAGGLSSKSIADLGTKDHNLLDGLLDDDHTQYPLLLGRAGGQILIGGTGNGDDLRLQSTSHATKGRVYVDDILDLAGNYIAETNDVLPTGTGTKQLGNSSHRFKALLTNTVYTYSTEHQATTATFYARNITGSKVNFATLFGGSSVAATLETTGSGTSEWSIPRAGDISHLDGKFTIFDKASGNGIKVDTTTPTFGWRDLLGEIRTRGVGATDPNDAVYDGANIRAYQFAVNDECWIDYHIPHDYEAGTDIHLHFHWSHNGTLVTGGNVTWAADITYAKGHNQAAFPATVNSTVVGNASTTQYQHIITEVQISTSGGAAGQIDTDNLEPDGVLMVRGYLSANNITVSGGAVPDPFLHYMDIHYQSTNIATKAKAPNFYV